MSDFFHMLMIHNIFRASFIFCLLLIVPAIGHSEDAFSTLFSECATQNSQYAITSNHSNGQTAGYIVAYGCSAIAASHEVESFFSSLDPSVSDQQAHRLQMPMIALSSGWKVGDKHWAQLHDRFESLRHYEIEHIRSHPDRLLYYFLAADINQGNASRFNSELRRLMRKVALPSILPFTLVYSSVSRLHPNDSAQEWVSSSLKILRKIKSRRLVRIMDDQSSMMMMAALMPISRSDIQDAASLSHVRFLQLQSSVLEVQLTVFNAVLKKTNDVTKAMQVCAMLKPHIVDAIMSGAKQKVIQVYLDQQVLSPIFTTLINGYEEDLENNLYTFFARMYSPVSSKTGQSISYLQGNLGKIAQWYNSDPVRVKKIIQQDVDPDKYSAVLAFLPDIYLRLGSRGRQVFDDLLFQLSDNMMNNGLFIAGLFHKTTFFQWVGKKGTGAFASMRLPSGKQLPKYAYILTAPSSYDDPASFIQKFNHGEEVDHSKLMSMTHMSLAQLEDRLVEKRQTIVSSQHHSGQSGLLSDTLTDEDFADISFTAVALAASIVVPELAVPLVLLRSINIAKYLKYLKPLAWAGGTAAVNYICNQNTQCERVMDKIKTELGLKKFQQFEADLAKEIGLTDLLESERALRLKKLAEKYHIPLEYLAYLPQAKFLRGFFKGAGKHHSKKKKDKKNNECSKKDKKANKCGNKLSTAEALRISGITDSGTKYFSAEITMYDSNGIKTGIVVTKSIPIRISPICNVNSSKNRLLMRGGNPPISDQRKYKKAIKKAYKIGYISKDTLQKKMSPASINGNMKCELHHLDHINVLTGNGIYALLPMALHRGKGITQHIHNEKSVSGAERYTHRINLGRIYTALGLYIQKSRGAGQSLSSVP